jgi:hypothetical protein
MNVIQWHIFGVRPRLQRRDRDGIAPSFLLPVIQIINPAPRSLLIIKNYMRTVNPSSYDSQYRSEGGSLPLAPAERTGDSRIASTFGLRFPLYGGAAPVTPPILFHIENTCPSIRTGSEHHKRFFRKREYPILSACFFFESEREL